MKRGLSEVASPKPAKRAKKAATKKASTKKQKATPKPRPKANTASAKTPKATKTTPKATEQPKWKHGTLDRAMEDDILGRGYKRVVGTDEAGRGPLAGPVVAAACFVPPGVCVEGVNDSKKLNEAQREELYTALTTHPKIVFATSIVDHARIDEINILQASMEAMANAVGDLPGTPADYVLVDGPRVPAQLKVECEPVIKGDSKCYSIAAASIIAKVTRDRIMVEYDAVYPLYRLAQHKGYPTKSHQAAVIKHGPCAIHRRTFAPIKHMDLTLAKHQKQLAQPAPALRVLATLRLRSS